MSVRARWLLAGLIVVVAAAIALWPRNSDTSAGRPAPDLAAARARAALTSCASGQPATPGSGQLGAAWVECLADGSTVDLAAVVAGRPVLVNVWATWCGPCRQELPLLAEYAAGAGAVPVVGVAARSDPAGALELLSALHVRFANLLDRDDSALRALRVPDALPASYLVQADGTVRFVTEPRLFRSVDEVRAAVARYEGGRG